MALDTAKHKNILIKILKDIYTDATISPILGFKGGTAATFFYGLDRAVLKKSEFRNPPAFLPRSLLRAGNQPRQGESFPTDKLFRPAESVLIIWILLEIVSNFVQQIPGVSWELK